MCRSFKWNHPTEFKIWLIPFHCVNYFGKNLNPSNLIYKLNRKVDRATKLVQLLCEQCCFFKSCMAPPSLQKIVSLSLKFKLWGFLLWIVAGTPFATWFKYFSSIVLARLFSELWRMRYSDNSFAGEFGWNCPNDTIYNNLIFTAGLHRCKDIWFDHN